MSIWKDSASYMYINRFDCWLATDLADNLGKKKKKKKKKEKIKKNSSETVLLLDRHDLEWLVLGTVKRLINQAATSKAVQ